MQKWQSQSKSVALILEKLWSCSISMECMTRKGFFAYRRVSKVNLYSINEFEDYFYGYMVPDTGYLKYFALYPYEDGVVIQMPSQRRSGNCSSV